MMAFIEPNYFDIAIDTEMQRSKEGAIGGD
jgi:hypothetical protein